MSGLHEIFGRASLWLWPALADHLWQAALFAGLVYLICLALRGAPARVRHALWLVASFKFLAPPALFAFLAARLGLDASALFGAGAGGGAPLVLLFAEPLSNTLEVTVTARGPHRELFCALTLLWLAGCGAFAAAWAGRRRESRRAWLGGRVVVAGREFAALESARRRLGLKCEVRLVLTAERIEPAVWGALRPTVALSEEVSGQLGDEELEAVMLHELAHVERRDNLLASSQMALACLFWFHPAVWLVGRRLLEERERACDERVLEAGGAPESYAAGILKVVRFCFGWRVAGVSGAAAGSDLRRRIEMIMFAGKNLQPSRWQRALPPAAVAAALALTAAPCLFDRAGVSAQSRGRGGAGAPIVAAGGGQARALPPRGEEGPAVREVMQTPETAVTFENAAGAPAVFTEARMRVITREQFGRAEEELGSFVGEVGDSDFYATMPVVTLMNVSDKRIREVGFGFEKAERIGVMTGYAASLAPGESQTFPAEWGRRNVVMLGDASALRLKLVWAVFDDGTNWGLKPTPLAPPEPPAPAAPAAPSDVPSQPSRATPAAAQPPTEAAAPAEPSAPIGAGGPIRAGVLNGKVLSKPLPAYPAVAQAARAQGTVAVRVVINEDGGVESAEATSGHPLLRGAAVEAARQARFSPTRLSGRPVKVTGTITYNFVLADDESGGQP